VKPALFVAFLASFAACQADPIDDFIKAELVRTKSPAIAVGIIKDGKLVKNEIYGKFDVEAGTDAKKGDLFEIGSITKQFTGAATLLLVEDGKLKLDDPISKYLPEAPREWSDIKISNLLYQTSGLADYAFEQGIGLVDTYDRAKWMGIMTKLPLDFQPGVAWAYSNSNYALLGWVIEKASGKSYMDFMRTRVFNPLQMEATTFSDPAIKMARKATGYMAPQTPTGSISRAPLSSASINSDGTILSNIEDMAKWDAALRERKLLKKSSWDVFFKAAGLSSGRWRPYGTGINVSLPGLEPYYGHGGNSAGYSAGYASYPKAGVSVIVMGNIYAFGGEPMAKQIAELYQPSLKPTSPAVKEDPDAKRTETVKQALLALGEGKADETVLEQEVLAPMKTRRAGMGRPFAFLAGLEKMEYAGELAVGKDKLVTYKITTKTRDFVGTILFSSAGKVAMASLRPDGPPKAG
jgi:CubicO group peptidase (beta-lactamase class C family)